jgi:hypothetical protein
MRKSTKVLAAGGLAVALAIGVPLSASADGLVQAGSITCHGSPAPYAYIGATVHGSTRFNHNRSGTVTSQSFNDLFVTYRYVTAHYTYETGSINTFSGATATGAGMACDN